MDSKVARAILLRELDRYRGHSYAELEARAGDNALRTEINQDDVTYQVVIDFAWDDKPNGAVRVFGTIDDGGWRAFIPLCDSFIKAPDGSFVDED